MNSRDRHNLRYLRRKEKRESKNRLRNDYFGNLDNAFKFHKVMYYADKCCNGVGFKKSTQSFKLHMFTNIATCCYNICNMKYVVGDTYKFQINERGKIRDIDAPHIKDRLVHKVLANEIIIPIYEAHLIYDNGASMRGKGFMFALNRVKHMLHNWYNVHGRDGYVLLIDFSKFFPNSSHDVIRDIHKRYIYDDRVIKVIEDYLFISSGIALGVEIAQREASMIPNELDHFIRNKGYMMERYMDDTLVIVPTYNDGLELMDEYKKIADRLHIRINSRKTKIVKLDNYFSYCKWIFYIDNNGRVINIPCKDTIYRERRKLRKMIRLNVDSDSIDMVMNSFISYLNIGNCYKYVRYLENIKIVGDKSSTI